MYVIMRQSIQDINVDAPYYHQPSGSRALQAYPADHTEAVRLLVRQPDYQQWRLALTKVVSRFAIVEATHILHVRACEEAPSK